MKNFKLKSSIIVSAIILGTINLINAGATNSSGSIQLSVKSLGSGAMVDTVNGKDVIRLYPTNGGVSHTYFEKFSVDSKGLTIQNGIQCNCVSNGSKVIINEVVGNSVSNINGRIDLVGDSAKLFIINPNGINVNNGASFSNRFDDVVLSAAKENEYSYGSSVQNGKLVVGYSGSNVNFNQNGMVRVSDVYAGNINVSRQSTVSGHHYFLGLFTRQGNINNNGVINAENIKTETNSFINKGVLIANNSLNLKANSLVNFNLIKTHSFHANINTLTNINNKAGSMFIILQKNYIAFGVN